MTIESAKIRVKLGEIEIEYEGPKDYLQDGLLQTLKSALELGGGGSIPKPGVGSTGLNAKNQIGGLSTDTIATLTQTKSGPDLAVAAAAHLHFVKGKMQFSRQEIIDEMRTAPAYFKETFINNLTKYLASLTKADRLRLVAADTYALSMKEKQSLEAKLANG